MSTALIILAPTNDAVYKAYSKLPLGCREPAGSLIHARPVAESDSCQLAGSYGIRRARPALRRDPSDAFRLRQGYAPKSAWEHRAGNCMSHMDVFGALQSGERPD